jgi:hypothetical protein
MIDPYFRTFLIHKENSPTFYIEQKVFNYILRFQINMEYLSLK